LPGTAKPGEGERLTKACLAALNGVPFRLSLSDCDRIIEGVGGKCHDQDVAAVFAAAWERYCRTADSHRNDASVRFGWCLRSLSLRLPAESAGASLQKVLRRWPAETRPFHRQLLAQLHSNLLPRVPETERPKAIEVAAQQGLTEEEVQAALQPQRPTPGPPRRAPQKITREELADPEKRSVRLRLYLNDRSHLSLSERLDLLRELDNEGLLYVTGDDSFPRILKSWFWHNPPQGSFESIIRELGRPECVGGEQRVFTVMLSKQQGERGPRYLWELAEYFPGQ
jgi:hypothetical protein